MKYYLAGPMTGIPQFNFPAFDAAAARLRSFGFEVISPHEQDSPAVQEAARKSPDGKLDSNDRIAGESWGQILARDVRLVADDVDGIVFLPGWEKSRGARLEAFVGLLCNKQFALYDENGNLDFVSGDYVRAHVAGFGERAVVFAQIERERTYQNAKWGTTFDDQNTVNDWTTYINQYAGDAARMDMDPVEVRTKLVKVASLAVAAIETCDRNCGFPPRHYDKPASSDFDFSNAEVKQA